MDVNRSRIAGAAGCAIAAANLSRRLRMLEGLSKLLNSSLRVSQRYKQVFMKFVKVLRHRR